MKTQEKLKALFLIPVLLVISSLAVADIEGIDGPTFNLTAKTGHIVTGDGNSLLTWGYANGTGQAAQMQYPGPTLKVTQGQTVTVNLTNNLAEPVSMVFPGQSGVEVALSNPGVPGLITNEALPGGSVTYVFTATEPGTYLYQSGTNPETQIEMGLIGALIVYPSGTAAAGTAYGTGETAYDREYLFFLSDMDRSAHEGLDGGIPLDPASYSATLWFMNGRNGPDTMYPDSAPWLPAQPYGALAQAHPSERVLLRIIGGGRDLHPFHHHGNNTWQIAQDGRVLKSAPNASPVAYPDFIETNPSDPDWLPNLATVPDQAVSNYTITISPGNTYDAIFTWTGRDLNWDIYAQHPEHVGAACGDTNPNLPGIENPTAFNATLGKYMADTDGDGDLELVIAPEDPNSHCKALSVKIPEQQALTFGGLWSGSPYLGTLGVLPPLQGGLNPNGGYSFMWHSHTERELTNDDIFPGGMMTMFIVEAVEIALD